MSADNIPTFARFSATKFDSKPVLGLPTQLHNNFHLHRLLVRSNIALDLKLIKKFFPLDHSDGKLIGKVEMKMYILGGRNNCILLHFK